MTDLTTPEAIRAGRDHIYREREWARFDALDAGTAAHQRGEDRWEAAEAFVELEDASARAAGYADRFEAAEMEARIDALADPQHLREVQRRHAELHAELHGERDDADREPWS